MEADPKEVRSPLERLLFEPESTHKINAMHCVF